MNTNFKGKLSFLKVKRFKVDERWVFDANSVEGRLAPMRSYIVNHMLICQITPHSGIT